MPTVRKKVLSQLVGTILTTPTKERLTKAGLPERYFALVQVSTKDIPALMNSMGDSKSLRKALGRALVSIQDELNSPEPSNEMLEKKVNAFLKIMVPPVKRKRGEISACEIFQMKRNM